MDNYDDRAPPNLDKVIVLPLGDSSKRIAQALSNDKALKILELLAEKTMSATSIANDLDLPLTTVKYNLDTLIETDLIRVKETKWSQKGRQIKIYEPVQKLIVVAPGTKNVESSSIRGILQKYLGLAMGAGIVAGGIEYISRTLTGNDTSYAEYGIMGTAMDEPNDTIFEPVGGLLPFDIGYSPGLWFFLGCVFVIFAMLIWEMYYRKK